MFIIWIITFLTLIGVTCYTIYLLNDIGTIEETTTQQVEQENESGYDHLDRMYGDYDRYTESRENYGAGEESDKSYHYMTKSLGEFMKYLFEEAETPQQKQMLRETIQESMM